MPIDQMSGVRAECAARITAAAAEMDAPDLTANKRAQWGRYIQALRDLPEQFSDPAEVIFPELP